MCEAAQALGIPHLAGEIELAEAASAWRLGRLDEAGTRAREAAAAFARAGSAEAELLALAFAAFLGESVDLPELVRRSADVSGLPPGVRIQFEAFLGSVASGTPERRESALATARRLASTAPCDVRLEVLSIGEAAGLLRGVPPGAPARSRGRESPPDPHAERIT